MSTLVGYVLGHKGKFFTSPSWDGYSMVDTVHKATIIKSPSLARVKKISVEKGVVGGHFFDPPYPTVFELYHDGTLKEAKL